MRLPILLLLCLAACPATIAATPGGLSRDVVFVAPLPGEQEYEFVVLASSRSADAAPVALRLGVHLDGKRSGEVIASPPVETDAVGCTGPARLRLTGDDSGIGSAGAILSSIDINPGQRHALRHAAPAERAVLLDAVARWPGTDLDHVEVVRRALHGDPQASEGFHVLVDAGVDAKALLAFTVHDAGADTLTSVLALLERNASGAWRATHVDLQQGCSDCEGTPAQYGLRAFGDFKADGTVAFLLKATAYESWSHHLLAPSGAAWERIPVGGGGGC